LRGQGFTVNLAVGFTRFGSYAVAKAKEGITIFRDPAEEQNAAHAVALNRLNIEAKFRDALFKLGIKTVGALLALPAGGLRERFGKEVHRLHRMAAGDLWTPLEPSKPAEPARQKYLLDDAEDDTTRLLFLIKQQLHPLLTTLAARHQALVALWLSLLIDHGDWFKESLRPAVPTLDAAQIVDLIRLRLESLQLAAGVIEIELRADACAATSEQLRLFNEKPTRDLEAANRALARLRAEFGDDAVVCAKLTDGHLPEARFIWEPLMRVKLPEPKITAAKVLIRRVNAKPLGLAGGPYHSHEDGWLLLGPKHGNIDKLSGPYVFAGGWWNREIQREYYFAETRGGDLLWLYYDRVRRRWFLQGAVE
jgi:protein ImuB